jgi:hypothetical protein
VEDRRFDCVAVRVFVARALVRGARALVKVQLVRALSLVRHGARLERHVLFVDACIRSLRCVPDHPLQDLVALLHHKSASEPACPLFADRTLRASHALDALRALRPDWSQLADRTLRANPALDTLLARRPDWSQLADRTLRANHTLDALLTSRPDWSQIAARTWWTDLALYALLPARSYLALRSRQSARALLSLRTLCASLASHSLDALRPSDSRHSLHSLNARLARHTLCTLRANLASVSLDSASPAPRLYLGAFNVKCARSSPPPLPLARARKSVALLHSDLSLAGGSACSTPSCAAAARGGLQRLDQCSVPAVDGEVFVDRGARSQPLLLDVFEQVGKRRHLDVTRCLVHEEFIHFLADLLRDARGPRHPLAPHEELADVGVLQPIRAP